MLTFFYLPVVSVVLYDLAWHSNGSVKCPTFECCFLISKYYENCNAMSSFTVIRHTSWNILFVVQLNIFISLLWLFDSIWIYMKNQNSKKWEDKDDLSLFLNGSNFMRNWIIIPMLLVMAFFKVTHPKVYLSVNKFAEISKKDQTYMTDIFTLCE